MSDLDPDFEQKYGPWVLICGASDGIGEAFAKQAAEAGLNLVLMARRETVLDELAAELQAAHGIETRVIAADLTSPSLMETVVAKTQDLEIGLLLYVSGSATDHVDFVDGDLDFWIQQLRLNCDGPVLLGHHFGKKMRERGHGGMMFLTSLACQSGASRMSLYTGTKAFDQMFAESLWHELSPHGVDPEARLLGSVPRPQHGRHRRTSGARRSREHRERPGLCGERTASGRAQPPGTRGTGSGRGKWELEHRTARQLRRLPTRVGCREEREDRALSAQADCNSDSFTTLAPISFGGFVDPT